MRRLFSGRVRHNFAMRLVKPYSPGGDTSIEIRPGGDFQLTFRDLDALSKIFGTDRIDLGYCEGEADWSDYTPGDSSSFVIRVWGPQLS